MKNKLKEPNVIVGYDDGEVTMYYWQKEPIKINRTSGFVPKVAWYHRDWLTEFKWRLQKKKPITFNEFKKKVKIL